ncbi:hypothetical protein [Paenarthrobacter nicotinovorans]|uniref:hypothetical protein n=1 Tax=Paenarthrobacter nicotinovorans TaxID=29320 RepID=UPI0006884B20|nr:hypothetical protein [Paenarthrobacter nicotinovorans]
MARPNPKKSHTTGAVPKRRGPGRTIWLIAMGLVAGVAGGAFAFRVLVPPGEPEPIKDRSQEPKGASRLEKSPADASEPHVARPAEILVPEEPVEISTRMRPGEWTEESLLEHVENYKQQIRDMGAPESQIVTDVERTEQGAARVVVSWDRTLP